jgi:hypothetical protein
MGPWTCEMSRELKTGVNRGNAGKGRPPGAKNKRTRELEAKMAETAEHIAAAIPGAFGGDAHALLMVTYKDVALDLDVRLDAAKAAISYEKPRLQGTTLRGDENSPLRNVTRLESVIVDPMVRLPSQDDPLRRH